MFSPFPCAAAFLPGAYLEPLCRHFCCHSGDTSGTRAASLPVDPRTDPRLLCKGTQPGEARQCMLGGSRHTAAGVRAGAAEVREQARGEQETRAAPARAEQDAMSALWWMQQS